MIGEKSWNQFWACTKPVTLVDRGRGHVVGEREQRVVDDLLADLLQRPVLRLLVEGRARLLQQRVPQAREPCQRIGGAPVPPVRNCVRSTKNVTSNLESF